LGADVWEHGTGETVFGRIPIAEIPGRRWREVTVHHADLGHGYSWSDWPRDFVRIELERMTMQWASRRPMGLTTLPAAALAVPDDHRLAWLFGRAEIEGLAPAGVM
jgi:maleylpyruvate isomerase